jgi:hypothetical protein
LALLQRLGKQELGVIPKRIEEEPVWGQTGETTCHNYQDRKLSGKTAKAVFVSKRAS